MLDFLASFIGHVLYEIIWVKIIFSFVKRTHWGRNFTAIGLWWTVFVSTILLIVVLTCSLFLLKMLSFSNVPIAIFVTFIIWVPLVKITGKYLHKVGG